MTHLPYRYLLYSLEHDKGTGTPHIQGYVELTRQMRFNALKKTLPRFHFEAAKGSVESQRKYIGKENKPTELGTPGQPGKRNDLDAVRALALEDGLEPIVTSFNYQQIKVAETFLKYCGPSRQPDDGCEVIWISGASGAGKTKLAYDMLREADEPYYIKQSGSKWFDGYLGQKVVLIDDIDPEDLPIKTWLQLFDRYPMRVEGKGTTHQFLATKIIVTSIYEPEHEFAGLFSLKCQPIEQLTRRISYRINL